MYIYLDKEKAKLGTALVLAVFTTPKEASYFDNKAVEFVGDDLPHYITYEEINGKGKVREATIQERYERGQYTLESNQYVKEGVVKTIPPQDKKYVKGEFNTTTEKWEEKATPQEILDEQKAEEERKYRDKLPQIVHSLTEENKNLKDMLDFILLDNNKNPIV